MSIDPKKKDAPPVDELQNAPPCVDRNKLTGPHLKADSSGRSNPEIAASETRYRRLFEAACDGILLLDPGTCKITDANPFMTNLLGYRLDELVGKELWEIGLLKDEEASRMAFLELQKSCYLRYEHLPLQSKTGELHDVEFVSNLYDEAGRPVIQCNIRDITKHKHTEQQLTLLAVCVANLNEIVIITEADLLDELGPKIVFVNAAFERITGYTSAEVIGRSPRFLQGEKTERPVLDEIRRALIRQKPIRRRIISYTKDGREVCFDMDIVPVFDAKGGCTHFAATSRDITEEQKAQEQMRWKTAFFESQVNSALDGILIVGNDGKKILQNQRMVDLWEIPQEIAGQVDDGRQLDWVTSHTRYPAQFAEQVGYLVAHPDGFS